MQQILVYIVLLIAIVYLLKKYVFKSANKKDGCDKDCDC